MWFTHVSILGRTMTPFTIRALPAFAALALCLPGQALNAQPQIAAAALPAAPSYAALADWVIAADVIVDATIRSAVKLTPAEAPGVGPGRTRFYVVADVINLIRGPAAGVPTQVSFLLDVVPDAGGRLPKLRKRRTLAFAKPVPTRPNELQLIAPDATLEWSATLDQRVRSIAQEVLAPDSPPAIAAVGNAFHVAGTLPGESETQVFLRAANGQPLSLSIVRRPGEATRWGVALGEIVDEAAAPPARDTLLWYRLACGLPAVLPDEAIAQLGPADASAAGEDYRFVREALGPCAR